MSSKRPDPTSAVDLGALPTPEHWTLLFKHGKSTTLLSVLPTQPIAEIKEMLLAALKSRNISTFPGSNTLLPEDSTQIQLGVLRDRKDATRGWTPLVVKDQNSVNGKAGKKKAGGRNEAPTEGVAGAGLVDGSWVAYRMAPQLEDEEDDMMLDVDEAEWDVILPSYEEEDADA